MSDQIALGAPTFGDEELSAVREVLSSGWVAGQGPRAQHFETAFAELCGAPHAIAVNNCTAALHLALLALGAGPGDEVIVADYTFPATGHAVMFTGADPVFADVDAATFCVDVDAVAALIGPRTVGVIAVDVVGQCADYGPLRRLTAEHGLFLVQDAACSAGATYLGKPAGHPDLADVACFSLHGRKGITCGEGGVVTTGDAELAQAVRRRSAFGIESAHSRDGRDELAVPVFAELGFNYKLSDIAAAIASVQLGRLPDLLERRGRVAAGYAESFRSTDGVQVPQVAEGREHTWQSFLLTIAPELSRDRIAVSLRREGIGANIGTYASHLQPVYGDRKPCPISADIFARHLAIPMHANLTDDDVDRVVAAVERAIATSAP